MKKQSKFERFENVQTGLRRMQKSNSLYQDDLKDIQNDLVNQLVGSASVSQQLEKGVTERSEEFTLTSQEDQIQELNRHIILMTQKNSELQNENQRLTKELDATRDELKESKNNQDSMDRALFDIKKQLERQEHIERQHREQIERFEDEVASFPDKVNTFIGRILEMFQNLASIMNQEVKSEEKVEMFSQEVSKLHFSEIPESEEKITSFKVLLGELLRDIGGRFQHLRQSHQDQVEALENHINDYINQINQLQEQLHERSNAGDLNETAVVDLQTQVEQLQSEIYTLKDQNVKIQYQLKLYQKKDQENMVIAQQNKTMLQMVSQMECYKSFKDKFQELENDQSTNGRKMSSPIKSSSKPRQNSYGN